MDIFLYSNFFLKFICLLQKKGKKQKIEKKVLKVFKKVDFFLFVENIFFLKLPFKLFPKKFRTGRHSYIYKNLFILLKKKNQYEKALSYFYLVFKKDSKRETPFLEKKLLEYIKGFVLEKQYLFVDFKLKKKKEALFLKSLKHYRWK